MPPKKGGKGKKGGNTKKKKTINTKDKFEEKLSDLPNLSSSLDNETLASKSIISSAHLSTKSIGLRKLPKLISSSNKKVSFNEKSKISSSSYKSSVSEKLSSSFLAEIFGDNYNSPTTDETVSSSALMDKSILDEENDKQEIDLNQKTINLNDDDEEEITIISPEKSALKLKLEQIQKSTSLNDVSDYIVKDLIYHLSGERWGPALQSCKKLVLLQPFNQRFLDFYELLNSLIKNKKIIKKYKIKPIKRYLPAATHQGTENQETKKEGKKTVQKYTYKSRARKNNQNEPLDKQAGIPVGTPGVPSNLPVPPNRPNEQLKQFIHVNSARAVEKTFDEIIIKEPIQHQKKLLSNRQNSRNSVNSNLSKQDSIRDEIEFKLSVKLTQHTTKINE